MRFDILNASNFFENFDVLFNVGSIFFSLIFWAVLAYFFSGYAKRQGENPKLHFVLILFGQLAGLAASLIIIFSKKSSRNSANPNGIFNSANQGFGNSYYQAGQPQYNTVRHICPSCGHEQINSGFCMVCGSQIK